MKPIVSVIMAAYNSEKYIREAISSILKQTYKNFELIIINDGSTDNTKKIITSYNDERIILIDQLNKGPAAARNEGLRIARGRYIAIFDSDDISHPERLQIQKDFLEANPKIILVGSNARIIDEQGEYVYNSNQPLHKIDILKTFPNSPFIHPSIMFRKTILLHVDGYPEMPISEDTFFLNKIVDFGDVANLPQCLIDYRITSQSLSRKSSKIIKLMEEMLGEYINDNSISNDKLQKLKKLKNSLSERDKKYQYHLLLGKKYLWNNNEPSKARRHISEAFKIFKYRPAVYLLFFLSLLPSVLIVKIYKVLK